MANNIKKIREKQGISQAALAKKVGIAPNSVYRHEKDQRGLDQDTIDKYAKALKVKPSNIIEEAFYDKSEDAELLEQVASESVSFLIKNDLMQELDPKQIAQFITESYTIFKEAKDDKTDFALDDSHLKLIYKQVSNG